jgi:HlyD family secretion protein
MRFRHLPILGLIASAAACGPKEAPPLPVYQALAVEHRDIVVSARANGTVRPDTTVEVKSQASGEVLQVLAQTGQIVPRGELMVRIDPRIPKNNLDLAQSNLDVAQARLTNSTTQKERSEALFESQSITKAELDQAQLDYATARAGVVSARVNLQNAQITLDQTDVRAPTTGTIIELDVERGQIISSPMSTVGEGTVLLRMADLGLVQVSTLVDETDIGKIQPGMAATVTVDAYPNRPFPGRVLKIEPLATVSQNVTAFPVLVRIENRDGLLKPGMNAEVLIHVGRRDSVLAVPNSALRTMRDVNSAAGVLGLDSLEVQARLAQADAQRADSAKRQAVGAGAMSPGTTVSTAGGRASPAGGGGGRRGGDATSGGRYVVFVRRHGTSEAINVTTGLTDLDYSEVVSGLSEGDSVLVLPSTSLVESQKEFTERMQRLSGGGGLPGLSNTQSTTGKAPGGAPARP